MREKALALQASPCHRGSMVKEKPSKLDFEVMVKLKSLGFGLQVP